MLAISDITLKSKISILLFIIEPAMTVSFKLGIGNLLSEFLAYALVFLRAF